ncbi:hypothetical protein N7462_002983 [Penicillium macrosclerotiorum]|uniref:uncharacterized protein n=1 Tax=Penicillium macrosclerotiorum TaxID=303699 RepID=UPI0025496E30|nr:uncharacterized protein N7462_002983 [Penicillium macrosclerotiorum]KAJ5688591.1 hypothetical protein N7462_002983 [Penicillium macrosclerotiorum]
MRARYSPSSALLDFDREIHAPSLVSESGFFLGSETPPYSLPGMPNTRTSGWKVKGLDAGVPGGAGHVPLQPPRMVSMADIPVSSSSNAAGYMQPPLGFAQAPSDTVTSFLAPDSYLSDHRASPVSDPVGSLYAWSSASGAEILRPASSSAIDPVIASTTASPFMQSYYSYGPSAGSITPLQAVSGYTPQQINKWCMESDPSAGFYQSASSYPAMSPLAFPPADLPPNIYPSIHENMSTAAEQWFSPIPSFAGPSTASSTSGPAPDSFLSPPSTSGLSLDSSPAPTVSDFEPSSNPRPNSPPFNPADLSRYGIPAGEGVWRCAHPGCTSQALFRRGCDLRKHFNRHRKHLFCRHESCPQSRQGGFSSKKDRARHEAKHNPGIICEWENCGRVFSRTDNMKDHVRRIHRRGGSR